MPRREDRSQRIKTHFRRQDDADLFTVNERRILNLVRSEGPISRSDLARRTGLTMQSAVRLVDELSERGFVRIGEEAIRNAGPGQPSLPVLLVPDAAYTAGVSVTSDALNIVLMDLSGRIAATRQIAVDGSDLPVVVERLRSAIAKMMTRGGIDPVRLFGVGIATTGYFIEPGRLNTPAAMGDWALRDLESELSEALKLPVWIENDGNAATIGENLFGVGRRYRNFAYLYIAAGLGGGLILAGAPFRGMRGNAGEFTGLLPVETRVDRPNLGLLADIVQAHGTPLDGIADLLARFDIAWPGVDEWLARTQAPLNAIVSAIGAIIDPEAIVIGGRLPHNLAEKLVAQATFHAAPIRDRERAFPDVVCAEAPGDAASLGAASIPLQEHFFL